MKFASLVFFALLIYAHHVCGQPLEWPLSAFREGECAPLGYALYGAIALVSVVYSADLKRFRDPIEAVDTIGFGILLLIAAVSPARWMLHRGSAGLLLVCAYVFLAMQLHRSDRALMAIHLCAPLVIAVVTDFEYGIWQKALISYFIVVATIHHHAAMREMRANAARAVKAA